MLRGVLPSDQLLQESGLSEYLDVKQAVQSGDVALLLRCLEVNQVAFVQASKLVQEGLFVQTDKVFVQMWLALQNKL